MFDRTMRLVLRLERVGNVDLSVASLDERRIMKAATRLPLKISLPSPGRAFVRGKSQDQSAAIIQHLAVVKRHHPPPVLERDYFQAAVWIRNRSWFRW